MAWGAFKKTVPMIMPWKINELITFVRREGHAQKNMMILQKVEKRRLCVTQDDLDSPFHDGSSLHGQRHCVWTIGLDKST